MTWELAPKLTVIFRHMVRGCVFPACWRLADVVPVPKGSASSDVLDCRSISNTPVLSKVFEKIVAGKLSNFSEVNSLLPPQFLYHRGLGTCDTSLTVSHHLQVALDGGM